MHRELSRWELAIDWPALIERHSVSHHIYHCTGNPKSKLTAFIKDPVVGSIPAAV